MLAWLMQRCDVSNLKTTFCHQETKSWIEFYDDPEEPEPGIAPSFVLKPGDQIAGRGFNSDLFFAILVLGHISSI